MRKENHRPTSKNPGQALVEFALILPLLLLLTLGVMDIGRLFSTKIVLTNAAREGANYLSYFPMDADEGFINTIDSIEKEVNGSNIDVNALNINFIDCCTPGSAVEVRVSTTVNLIFENTLLWIGLFSEPIELTSSAKMVVQ